MQDEEQPPTLPASAFEAEAPASDEEQCSPSEAASLLGKLSAAARKKGTSKSAQRRKESVKRAKEKAAERRKKRAEKRALRKARSSKPRKAPAKSGAASSRGPLPLTSHERLAIGGNKEDRLRMRELAGTEVEGLIAKYAEDGVTDREEKKLEARGLVRNGAFTDDGWVFWKLSIMLSLASLTLGLELAETAKALRLMFRNTATAKDLSAKVGKDNTVVVSRKKIGGFTTAERRMLIGTFGPGLAIKASTAELRPKDPPSRGGSSIREVSAGRLRDAVQAVKGDAKSKPDKGDAKKTVAGSPPRSPSGPSSGPPGPSGKEPIEVEAGFVDKSWPDRDLMEAKSGNFIWPSLSVGDAVKFSSDGWVYRGEVVEIGTVLIGGKELKAKFRPTAAREALPFPKVKDGTLVLPSYSRDHAHDRGWEKGDVIQTGGKFYKVKKVADRGSNSVYSLAEATERQYLTRAMSIDMKSQAEAHEAIGSAIELESGEWLHAKRVQFTRFHGAIGGGKAYSVRGNLVSEAKAKALNSVHAPTLATMLGQYRGGKRVRVAMPADSTVLVPKSPNSLAASGERVAVVDGAVLHQNVGDPDRIDSWHHYVVEVTDAKLAAAIKTFIKAKRPKKSRDSKPVTPPAATKTAPPAKAAPAAPPAKPSMSLGELADGLRDELPSSLRVWEPDRRREIRVYSGSTFVTVTRDGSSFDVSRGTGRDKASRSTEVMVERAIAKVTKA